ncbi:hypothetical protein BJX96DRAFT_148485 [Aspergillus floccosus]
MVPNSAPTKEPSTRFEDSGGMDRPSSPDYEDESSPEPVSRQSQEETAKRPQRLQVDRRVNKFDKVLNRENEAPSTALRQYEGGDLEHTGYSGDLARTREPSTEEISLNDEDEGNELQVKDDSGLKLRLDLNLDVEVELKAKIHGDITLSLLK